MTDADRDKAHAICREIEARMRAMGVITTAHYEVGVGLIVDAVAAAREECRVEIDRLKAERDAILRWSIRHAGYIGTFDLESNPPKTMWWAMGDNGRSESETAEGAARKAAGLLEDQS